MRHKEHGYNRCLQYSTFITGIIKIHKGDGGRKNERVGINANAIN